MFCAVPLLTLQMGCRTAPLPTSSSLYRDALQKFDQGDFRPALLQIDQGLRQLGPGNTEDAWRLRLLKAEIFIWQGESRNAVSLLMPEQAAEGLSHALAARRLVLLGLAESNMQQLDSAGAAFTQAERLNQPQSAATTCSLLLGQGKLAAMRGNLPGADRLFRQSLAVARREKDSLAETNAMGNLGVLNMRQQHYADAVDWFNAALHLAKSTKAAAPTIRLIGNLGWAYLEMGDLDRAADHFAQAAAMSRQNAMLGDEQTWQMNMGAVQVLQRNLSEAQHSYERSLALARQLEDHQDTIYGLNGLAKLAILQKRPAIAEAWNREAFTIEKRIGDHEGELYSQLNEAQIAALENNPAASQYLHHVLSTAGANVSLRAEALDALANLNETQHRPKDAQRLFEKAAAILDAEQQALGRPELQLSYPTNAQGVYDDYVHFLIANHRPDEALGVIERHRARTLMEGKVAAPRLLGSHTWPEPAGKAVAQDGHVVLTYWLAPGQSYMWLMGPHEVHMAVLPDQDQIIALVERYQSRLKSNFGLSPLDSAAGQDLYRTLIGPVQPWIPQGATVIVIPDGVLCGFNFETLVVPAAKPHYWIEDVSVNVASSVALLEQPGSVTAPPIALRSESLLVVGDPKSPPGYPALSHAHEEVGVVASHFGKDRELLLTGLAATPSAYFAAKPQDYAFIHFVAHGTASRVSPLDSSVVLSDDGKSYNLLARQIMSHPIHARLVTISACDSAGNRIFSAEGLIGMSWAFLRAGAREVVAALWEVNDASNPHFMELFYAGMAHGRDPALALREAKLEMLHSGTIYAKPYYWAPFVLYEGHGSPGSTSGP